MVAISRDDNCVPSSQNESGDSTILSSKEGTSANRNLHSIQFINVSMSVIVSGIEAPEINK